MSKLYNDTVRIGSTRSVLFSGIILWNYQSWDIIHRKNVTGLSLQKSIRKYCSLYVRWDNSANLEFLRHALSGLGTESVIKKIQNTNSKRPRCPPGVPFSSCSPLIL